MAIHVPDSKEVRVRPLPKLGVLAGVPVTVSQEDIRWSKDADGLTWRIANCEARSDGAVTMTFSTPGVFDLEAESVEGGRVRARVLVGIDENGLEEALRKFDGFLVMVLYQEPNLLFIPLPIDGTPPSDEDGVEPPKGDGNDEEFSAYLRSQLCEHARRLANHPYVSEREIVAGIYAVFPQVVINLGLPAGVREVTERLKGAVRHDFEDPEDALPQEVMAAVTEIVEAFSIAAFLGDQPPSERDLVRYPEGRRERGLTRWLRTVRNLNTNMHEYFRRRGFDSRRSRTTMLAMYNRRDGSVGSRFANRSAATSRIATTLFDMRRQGASRHIGRTEMASNGCANGFREQFGSGRTGSHDPYLPGTADDYALTSMTENSMTFSDGRGNALTYLGNDAGGTYYERTSDGTITWSSDDGRTYEATKNPDGTYDIEGSDGTELNDVELPKELTQDDPSSGGDGDDGDPPPDERPAPDGGQLSAEDLLQLNAQLHPEQTLRMVAIAQGGGRIYPAGPDGNHKPPKLEFAQGTGDIPEPPGRAGRTDPAPGSTGRNRRGGRPQGGRPVKLGDTRGVTSRVPPGMRRETSQSHRVSERAQLYADLADTRAALTACVKELEKAEQKRRSDASKNCVRIESSEATGN